MENIQEIMHEGKKILMLSHRGLRGAALLENLQACTRHLRDYPEDNILTLVDFTDTYLDDEITAYLQSDESKQASRKAERIAVVGVSGLKKLFFNMYNSATSANTRACDNIESAKHYLVS